MDHTKVQKTRFCSVLSTRVVYHQQKCLWRVDKKDMLCIVILAMDQHLEVKIIMMFVFSIHQTATITLHIWITLTNVHQDKMPRRFWQEVRHSGWVKWKFIGYRSKQDFFPTTEAKMVYKLLPLVHFLWQVIVAPILLTWKKEKSNFKENSDGKDRNVCSFGLMNCWIV